MISYTLIFGVPFSFQTSDLGLRLEVDFVFRLSQEQQQEQPLTKISLHSSFRTKLCDFLPLVSFVLKVHMFYVFDFLKSKT